MDVTVLLIIAAAAVWLAAASSYTRQAAWLLLLWIPVQGWVQLNVFNDATATVLLYEFQIVGLYLIFAGRALRSPESFGPPWIVRIGIPFVIWTLLLVPFSVGANGPILTLLGLRTYLLPLPLVWIGYRLFATRAQFETVAWLLMLQLALIAIVTVMQTAGVYSLGGGVFVNLPTGYGWASGIIRPPGTFSSPGHLGMYLLFAVPIAIGLLGLRTTFAKRLGFAIGLVAAIVALMANTQRATVVLLSIVLPLIAVVARRPQAVMRTAMALVVILVGALIGGQVTGGVFRERVATIADDIDMVVMENPTARMRDALRMPSPAWGGGLGIASPGAARLEPRPMGTTMPEVVRETIKPAESFMAALVYQTGVVGLLLFYFFLAALMGASLRAVRACRRTDLALLAAAIFCYQVGILLQSWAYDPLHYPPSRVFFWIWTGILLAMPRLAAHGAVPEGRAVPQPLASMRRSVRPAPLRPVAAASPRAAIPRLPARARP